MVEWKQALQVAAKQLGILPRKQPRKSVARQPVKPVFAGKTSTVKKNSSSQSQSQDHSCRKTMKNRGGHRQEQKKTTQASKSGVRKQIRRDPIIPAGMSRRVFNALAYANMGIPRPYAGYESDTQPHSIHAVGQWWSNPARFQWY